jgi:N-methylhydantoinase B
MSTPPAETLDGARLAILTNRFDSIVRSMMNTLFRTGRSGILNIARDFSCSILTVDSELLAVANSIPIHVVGSDMMTRSLHELQPNPQPGDAYLHNSPYHGNTHAADHAILVPVFDGDGAHRYTVLAKAHHADVGNSVPTTYHASARDVYEEGALIFPAVKCQQNYQHVDDIVRMCRLRIRVPDQWWGDHLAMLGAARIGERLVTELAGEVGWDTLHEYAQAWFDYSEGRMISAIRSMPAGTATASSTHDPFPGVPDGVKVTATATVEPDDARITVDLRDNPDCLPCGLNLTEASSRTAALIAVFNCIDPSVPRNSGSIRRVEVLLRENCCVGIPRHPASCSVATTNVADRAAHAVSLALASLADGLGTAESGTVLPAAVGVVSGNDPRRGGEPFCNQLFMGLSGGMGTARTDGWLTLTHIAQAGMMYRDSVEVDELKHPILVAEHRVVADTEGAGRYRGSPGVYAEFGPIGTDITVAYAHDGMLNPPAGARGGGSGSSGSQFRRTVSGELETLPAAGEVLVRDGERIVSYSSGGGGYGPPTEREVDRVVHDVREGYVSAERARAVYGVALADDGSVDEAATRELRAPAP